MAHQALDRREVDAGVEEVTGKRPPQIVRTEPGHGTAARVWLAHFHHQ